MITSSTDKHQNTLPQGQTQFVSLNLLLVILCAISIPLLIISLCEYVLHGEVEIENSTINSSPNLIQNKHNRTEFAAFRFEDGQGHSREASQEFLISEQSGPIWYKLILNNLRNYSHPQMGRQGTLRVNEKPVKTLIGKVPPSVSLTHLNEVGEDNTFHTRDTFLGVYNGIFLRERSSNYDHHTVDRNAQQTAFRSLLHENDADWLHRFFSGKKVLKNYIVLQYTRVGGLLSLIPQTMKENILQLVGELTTTKGTDGGVDGLSSEDGEQNYRAALPSRLAKQGVESFGLSPNLSGLPDNNIATVIGNALGRYLTDLLGHLHPAARNSSNPILTMPTTFAIQMHLRAMRVTLALCEKELLRAKTSAIATYSRASTPLIPIVAVSIALVCSISILGYPRTRRNPHDERRGCLPMVVYRVSQLKEWGFGRRNPPLRLAPQLSCSAGYTGTALKMLNSQEKNQPNKLSSRDTISISTGRLRAGGGQPPEIKPVVINFSEEYKTFDALVIVDSEWALITLRKTLGEDDKTRAVETLLEVVRDINNPRLFSWSISDSRADQST